MGLKHIGLLLALFVGLPGQALLGQTQIGGGTCNSSTLSGAYTFTLSGRQVGGSGTFTGVLLGNGTTTFDGTNKVTLTLNAFTAQGASTNLTYSGTYTVQSNCGGSITITSGGGATFTLLIYNQGKSFLITGSDATYDYSGGGSTQPAKCAASMLSGVYVANSNGFTLSNGVITGARNASGLMQLDGKGAMTVNFTSMAPGQSAIALSITGSYSLANGCAGTGALTDSLGNTYTLGFTVSGGTAVSSNTLDVVISLPGNLLFSGTAHAVYGQPTAAGGAE